MEHFLLYVYTHTISVTNKTIYIINLLLSLLSAIITLCIFYNLYVQLKFYFLYII